MRWKFNWRNPVGRGARATVAVRKTLYDFLGVDSDADAETIKRAFRKMIKEYHPDLHGGDADANRRTRAIISAHEVLGDPERRAAYDRYLSRLHAPPPRPEGRRTIFYAASTAFCLTFALVSIVTPTTTLINHVTAAIQHQPDVEAAARERGRPRDVSLTRDTGVATDASSDGANSTSHSISASDSQSRITKLVTTADASTNSAGLTSVSAPIKASSEPLDSGENDDLERVMADFDRDVQLTPEDAQAHRDHDNAQGRKGDADRALVESDPLVQNGARSAEPQFSLSEKDVGAKTSSSFHSEILGQKSFRRMIAKPRAHEVRPVIDRTSIGQAVLESRHTSQVALESRNSPATPVFGVGF
jgi:curved DNA-binding protein CbpA